MNQARDKLEVTVEIAPQLKGHVTRRSLISDRGTLEFQTNYSEIGKEKKGVLVKISANDFSFEIGFSESHFYIIRNNHKLEKEIEPVLNVSGNVHCFAIWSPTKLKITMLDDDYYAAKANKSSKEFMVKEVKRRSVALETHSTIPPNSLLTWARHESILPNLKYSSPEDFYETVALSLESIAQEIILMAWNNPFWNVTYDGARITRRKPKRETDIHPTIHSMLFQMAIAKNLEVMPEYSAAGGSLDFLILGYLENGEIVKACIEIKHAHSNDIENGLLKQLPAYMKACGSDFGIYGILFFKGKYFRKPSKYDNTGLRIMLENKRRAAGLENIRTLVFDMSQQKTPSKL